MLVYLEKYNKVTVTIMVLLQLMIAIVINEGIVGFAATFATMVYTIGLYKVKTKKDLRISLAVNSLLWSVYNFAINAIVSTVFTLVGFARTTYDLIKNK